MADRFTRVLTHHFEMTDPGRHRPAESDGSSLDVARCNVSCPELNRFFYTAIGGDWYWIDRLGWNLERWQTHLEQPQVQTWVACSDGIPAGYFELEAQDQGNVEIAYLGLLQQFVGRRLGGRLLSHAIEKAWAVPATRVWVHTCSLDHPSAVRNYEARGFIKFDEVESELELPDRPPGPWPGAR